MIYFLCPENDNKPSGGIRVVYRHVDILNAAGLPAAVCHRTAPFRCTWFANSTPVVYVDNLKAKDGDVLAISEVWAPNCTDVAPGIPKVIFNQNAYYTFGGYELRPNLTTAYTHPDVIAAICVSEDNRRYLFFAFPQLRLIRIHYSIDASLFYFQLSKRRRIAFMPRKHPEHALQVLGTGIVRGNLAGFEILPIAGMNELQTAEALRQSLIFLSFGYPEGCPLPPMEAMACGCITIGYHGNGGREYFLPDHSFPIEFGDIQTFAATIERVVALLASREAELENLRRRAANCIHAHYSIEQEREDVVRCWKELLAEAGSRRLK